MSYNVKNINWVVKIIYVGNFQSITNYLAWAGETDPNVFSRHILAYLRARTLDNYKKDFVYYHYLIITIIKIIIVIIITTNSIQLIILQQKAQNKEN